MANEAKWYFLDPSQQPVGPYTPAEMAAWYASGSFTAATLCWAEGEPEWLPLQSIPQLQEDLQNVAAPTQPPATAVTMQQPAVLSATANAEPGSTADPAVDPELADFQAEINAIEVETVEAERAQTPPPEQQTFQDDDGTMYKWDPALRRFLPADAEAAGTAEYDEADMVYEAEDEKIPALPSVLTEEDDDVPAVAAAETGTNGKAVDGENKSKGKGKKRSGEDIIEREKDRAKKAKEAAAQKAEWFELKQNTSVYISGLPSDVTEEEVAQAFSKCGVIKEDDQRRPRIKIYRDRESGMPKGDGLVTYLKDPSVDLALNIMDGAPLREDPKQVMRVQRAKFEQKGEEYVAKKKAKSKKKAAGVLTKQEKDLGWGGFDDKLPANKVTVVLEHMFHPSEMEEEATLREDLQDDIKTECLKMGPLEKVRVFHTHPGGIVTIKFKTDEAATKCIGVMEGRYFGGRQVKAHMWDGITSYHVKQQKESAEQQQARLEQFAAQIEGTVPATEVKADGTD